MPGPSSGVRGTHTPLMYLRVIILLFYYTGHQWGRTNGANGKPCLAQRSHGDLMAEFTMREAARCTQFCNSRVAGSTAGYLAPLTANSAGRADVRYRDVGTAGLA